MHNPERILAEAKITLLVCLSDGVLYILILFNIPGSFSAAKKPREVPLEKYRNIGISAHIDAGKVNVQFLPNLKIMSHWMWDTKFL